MLVSMTVRNIALIEQLQLEFQKGMQVLSGETGAGKSIIVDSINLVLGERADRGSRGPRYSNVPDRSYVTVDASEAAPVAPKRTQRVDDFADLDFGKIEL